MLKSNSVKTEVLTKKLKGDGEMISVNNLSKVFKSKGTEDGKRSVKGEFKVVNNISFDVKAGEKVAFIGPNGAGKSTTIKMLTGIIHPTSGSISVDGLCPTTDRKELAYKIGCMFGQKSQLWLHLPAIESYKLQGAIYDIPKKEFNSRLQEIVETFGIKDLIYSKPVDKLSLGERMKCEIANALLHNPKILFLDEPTIGVDIVTKQKVRNIILDLNKKLNTTIFLTSHDISDIEQLCDRVIIINHGTVVLDEKLDNLKSKYLTKRVITVLYNTDISNVKFQYPVLERTESMVKVAIDTLIYEVPKVIENLVSLGNAIDITTESMPLEEVISKIYTGGALI